MLWPKDMLHHFRSIQTNPSSRMYNDNAVIKGHLASLQYSNHLHPPPPPPDVQWQCWWPKDIYAVSLKLTSQGWAGSVRPSWPWWCWTWGWGWCWNPGSEGCGCAAGWSAATSSPRGASPAPALPSWLAAAAPVTWQAFLSLQGKHRHDKGSFVFKANTDMTLKGSFVFKANTDMTRIPLSSRLTRTWHRFLCLQGNSASCSHSCYITWDRFYWLQDCSRCVKHFLALKQSSQWLQPLLKGFSGFKTKQPVQSLLFLF